MFRWGQRPAAVRLQIGCGNAGDGSAGRADNWGMRIGVLGPLRVEVADRWVDLGGMSPRRLFAVLVAHVGEVVSVDALVDAVWGQAPPPSAVKALQSYVARLRRAVAADHLGRPGDSRSRVIVTARPGYRLVVPLGAVDADVFVERVRLARGAVDNGVPMEADRLLTEAFALWRGPPYGEFGDRDFGVAEARRLEEVRLAALAARLDAALLAGRDAEVVAAAEALCATYPLQERFWAQLVTALYRGARQADALAALRRVRVQLAEDVGADPGPELRLLEQRVLRQDPLLDASPSARPALSRRPVAGYGGSAAEVNPEPVAPIDVGAADGHVESPSAVTAERRVATVLVAAVGPASGDARWADPERLDVQQRRFQEICTEVVAAVGGTVTGQSDRDVTAVFGVLTAYDDHLVRAVDAALSVRDRCGESLGVVHVGVATGEVLRRGGPLGVHASGEPIRLATALRHVARPGEVLIAERAVTVARRRFELTAVVDRGVAGGPRFGAPCWSLLALRLARAPWPDCRAASSAAQTNSMPSRPGTAA